MFTSCICSYIHKYIYTYIHISYTSLIHCIHGFHSGVPTVSDRPIYIESVTDSSLGNTIVHSSRLTSLPVCELRLLTLGSLLNWPAYSFWALRLRHDGCFGNPLSRVFSSFILWMLKPIVLCVRFSDCSLRPVCMYVCMYDMYVCMYYVNMCM